jgi:hypothetical protein
VHFGSFVWSLFSLVGNIETTQALRFVSCRGFQTSLVVVFKQWMEGLKKQTMNIRNGRRNDTPISPNGMTFHLPVVTAAVKVVKVTDRVDATDDRREGRFSTMNQFSSTATNTTTTIATGCDDDDDDNLITLSDDTISSTKLISNQDTKQLPKVSSIVRGMLEFFISLTLSFFLKPVIGGIYIIRTLFLGYLLNYMVQFVSDTEETDEPWIPIQQINAAVTSSAVALDKGMSSTTTTTTSWPPPTFIALGILTMFAFIVHPDGYTWILIDKIRFVCRHVQPVNGPYRIA